MIKTPICTAARKLPLAVMIGLLSMPGITQAADTKENFCQSAGEENGYDCAKAGTFQADQESINAKLNELNRWLADEEQAQFGIQAKTSQPDSKKLQQKIRFNSELLAKELKQARTLQSQGDMKGAFTQVNEYLVSNPKDPNGWLLYGIALMNQNKLDDAADVFRKLIQLYPDSPEPYNNLAAVYARKGDNDKAVDTLLQAFDTHPSYAQVQANLKAVYAALATQAYNRALDLDNDTNPARANLAILDQVYQPQGAQPAGQPIASAQAKVQPQAPQPIPAPVEQTKVAEPAPVIAEVAATETQDPVIEERDVSEGTVPDYSADEKPATDTETIADNIAQVDQSQLTVTSEQTTEQTEVQTGVAITKAESKPAEPEPTVPASGLTDQVASDIEQLINNWASAWSAQDVTSYISYYTAQYTPDSSITHKQWVWGRNKRLSKPSFIKIDITNISLAEMADGRIRSVFQQRYQSNTYQDQVYKTLIFTQENGVWKIATETTL